MIETNDLGNVIKGTAAVTDSTGLRILTSDTEGSIGKFPFRGFEKLRFFTSNRGGATLFASTGSTGVAIVLAVDNDNQANYCLYLFVKHDPELSGKVTVISNNVITVQATNKQSTVTITGADSVTQYVLQLK